jgi:hypothetical protein
MDMWAWVAHFDRGAQVLRPEHWNKMRVKGSTNLYF